MTPTLLGRIQTRWLLLLLVGVPWVLVFSPFLLLFTDASLATVYDLGFVSLLLVGLLGTGWELIYHLLMQLRWEKDWPTLFGLVTAINEFVVLVLVLYALDYNEFVPVLLLFFSLWLWMWLVSNGPLRVLLPRWRYRGGRVL